jgi:hypothetical protein
MNGQVAGYPYPPRHPPHLPRQPSCVHSTDGLLLQRHLPCPRTSGRRCHPLQHQPLAPGRLLRRALLLPALLHGRLCCGLDGRPCSCSWVGGGAGCCSHHLCGLVRGSIGHLDNKAHHKGRCSPHCSKQQLHLTHSTTQHAFVVLAPSMSACDHFWCTRYCSDDASAKTVHPRNL